MSKAFQQVPTCYIMGNMQNVAYGQSLPAWQNRPSSFFPLFFFFTELAVCFGNGIITDRGYPLITVCMFFIATAHFTLCGPRPIKKAT